MPTPGERKALLFLGVVVVLGVGARGVAVLHSSAPADASARRALDAQIEAVDSARQRVSGRKGKGKKRTSHKGRSDAPARLGEPTMSAGQSNPEPLASPSPDQPVARIRRIADSDPIVPAIIDLDIATASEIETLRGIGPSLAARIAADRDSLGPFGSLDEVQRVRGIGPKLAAMIAPQVTFSLLPRHPHTVNERTPAPQRRRRKSRRGE